VTSGSVVSGVVATLAATTGRTLLAVAAVAAVAIAPGVVAFGLTVGGAIAVYFIVWWTVLFAVLPFAARAGSGGGVAGADPGAPDLPRLREKAVWTSVWADAVFLVAVALFPLAGL
jgi:predicted secreted protein